MSSQQRVSVINCVKIALVYLLTLVLLLGPDFLTQTMAAARLAGAALRPPMPVTNTVVTLQPSTGPGTAEPGVTYVSVSGGGFPSGTITTANVTVTLAPATSGPAMTAVVKAVTALVGTSYRISFLVAAGNSVQSPTVYNVSVSGTTADGTSSFTSGNTSAVTVNPPASITSLNPASGQVGNSVAVTINAKFTFFFQGATLASFGPGISVGGAAAGALGPITVTNTTTATAQLVISQTAGLGLRDVSIQTGAEIASLASGFAVTSRQVAVPNVVGLTQAAATSAITGAGLTVGTVTPQSSGTVAAGNVISESPLAGTLENLGTAVNLVVSTGPGQVAVPTSISVILSDNLVGPDGTTTASPTVLDQNGNPINDPSFQFTVTVLAQGLTSGNAPVVNGLAVQFPKVVKTLINENPTFDPTGQFASTDPSDPNFGLDTGGLYVVNVVLVGTKIAGSAPVIVLPSGTAPLTVGLKQYNDQLGNALSEAMVALQNNDLTGVAKAQSDLQIVQGNSLFSFDVLSTNNVVAPPDGFPASPAQMTTAGFSNGPDDASFNATLGSLLTAIQQAQSSVDAINPAAMTQADIQALQQAASSYTSFTQQLAALNPSSLAVTQNAGNLNSIMTVALPQLLDSMSAMSSAILAQVNPTATASNQYFKYLTSRRSAVRGCRLPASAVARLQPAKFSPGALPQRLLQGRSREVRRLKKAQLLDFFFTAFSIFTDLRGAALKNIITLSISLANDLLNLEAAKIINAQSTGVLLIDFIQASSSLSFACPNYSPTTVDGTDFSQDPSRMKVALLGCINSSLIASLATLKVPKDLAAAIRLIGKITGIVKDLGRNEGPAALAIPDVVQPGIFDPDLELVFNNGWPRVNQGSIPCVGLVIVFNLDDGSFAATNIDVLGVCN